MTKKEEKWAYKVTPPGELEVLDLADTVTHMRNSNKGTPARRQPAPVGRYTSTEVTVREWARCMQLRLPTRREWSAPRFTLRGTRVLRTSA